jgi:uncharacterized protein (DUF58 family)
MSTFSQPSNGGVLRDLWLFARYRIVHIDRPAWRRFFLALFALSFSFFLALYSTALREAGRVELAGWIAALSLVLTGYVAVKVVPYLARRTALERWMMKIEYEFTREGVVYLMIIAAISVAALNTGNNLLFIILASLLAGILVSGILSRIVLSQLELDFVLPDHVFAERPMISRLTIQNLKFFFPSFSITISAREPDKGKRKKERGQKPTRMLSGSRSADAALKHSTTMPRQKGASLPPRQILDAPVYVPYVPHRSAVTQHVELTFPRRGRYTQEGFRVSTKFPFGFLRKAHEVPSKQEILVLPNVQPTEEFYEILPLIGGELESLSKGRGHDLYAIRDYQESDTARHVDWKATAKAQALKVREFTREDERRLVLVFDPTLPRDDEKTLAQFEKAVTFCACLAWHFYEIDAQMQFLSDGFETSMAPSAEIIYPVLETLALIEPKVGPAAGVETLLARLASAARGFHIILTAQPRGSIPTNLWGSSYLVFIDSL